MASIKLTGDTSGEITISAPAVAGTNTLTLPADTGTFMTSTYTGGDVDIDSGTLHVDATNNRVGVGTSSPSVKFQVNDGSSSSNATMKIMNTANANTNYGCAIQFANQDPTYYMGQIAALRTNSAVNYSSYLTFSYSSNTTITEGMRLDSSGKVYIGCTSAPSSSVHGIQFCPVLTSDFSKSSAGSTGDIRHIGFYNTNGLVGGINTNGSGTTFNTSSDYRLKENVAPMSGSIDRIKQLKPITWSWIQDGSHGEGFLAHEAQEVVPEAVTGTKDAVDDEGNPVYQGIDQSKLVPLLTAALQEAITKIEDLETRIQTLENN